MEKKRPVTITIICILGCIIPVVSILDIFSPIARSYGAWYPPFLALSIVVVLISLIGLWMMKKWGVILYTANAVVVQVVMLVMGIWNVQYLLVVIYLGLLFSQYSKMD